MGFCIYSNSGKINYGIKHIILDTENDFKKITEQYTPGTTAYVVDNSNNYILNNQNQWVKIGGSQI